MSINRIVKMTFREDAIPQFREMFARKRTAIQNFPGCTHLELWQDSHDPRVFFTFSTWQSAAHLEAYRQSDFFAATWAITKQLFDGKPEAWTVKIQ